MAGAIFLSIREDLGRVSAVAAISEQGSPRPPSDAGSPTGYVNGQRYFLGAQERGETFRWIAAAQEMITSGSLGKTLYTSDNTPEGRPSLEPRLYSAWIATLAWICHWITGRPSGLSVEAVALWEPVLAHLVAIAGIVVFMDRRFGLKAAAAAGLFVALFPALGPQYLPGVLSPRPWAMLLGAWAVSLAFFWNDESVQDRTRRNRACLTAGIAAGIALWLDPAIGFPVVLVTAIAGTILAALHGTSVSWLRWAVAGATIVLAGWLIDRGPWPLAASELRSVHPFYAVAWLGFGILLHGLQAWRDASIRHWKTYVPFAAGAVVIAGSAVVQIRSGFEGWNYSSFALRHLSSLEAASPPFATLLDWMRAAPLAEGFFSLTPLVVVLLLLVVAAWFARRSAGSAGLFFALVVVLGLGILAFIRVRWWPVASLVSLPLAARLMPRLPAALRHVAIGSGTCYLAGLILWHSSALLASSVSKPDPATAASDVEALVFRHFTQWLVSHSPAGSVSAFATPTLSDSLVFHGGCRVLMSTAWESFPGHVAASRILSAPDWNEVEGILRRRHITHLVINSWDEVLPQFVRAPEAHRNETFHAQLQRWVFPRYLRPIPYRLPAGSGFDGQTIAVFRMTEPQDEALALSRLAEYFVEMDRDYLANAAARILGQSYADDPNANIARALVLNHTGDRIGFERELTLLADRTKKANLRLDWDRRVQLAIVFALGGRHDLARPEIVACAASLSAEHLYDLTPLQAFRYNRLADGYGVRFPGQELRQLAESLCAEYAPR